MTTTGSVPGDRSLRTRVVTGPGRRATAAAVCATAGAAATVATVATVVVGSPAGAVDDSLGTPGFCPDDDGVTVVVDFQRLGATTIVRCAPGSQTRSGLEVLQDAGFQVDGVQRWGEGFVCRIENRPSATETLSVPGDEQYREACVDTPPATAFWSYWSADEGGEWRYSQQGIKNSEVGPGGFEGWSFSLGTGADSAPRVAPERPDAEKEGSPGPSAGGTDGPSSWTGGDAAPDVRTTAPDGSGWSSALGLGAVAAVAAVAATMSLRRRHRRAPPEPRA